MGEPDCPVACAERGRRIPVQSDETFVVADHDFTKSGVIPSVIFRIDIPEEISGSWYHGKYFVVFNSPPHSMGGFRSCG